MRNSGEGWTNVEQDLVVADEGLDAPAWPVARGRAERKVVRGELVVGLDDILRSAASATAHRYPGRSKLTFVSRGRKTRGRKVGSVRLRPVDWAWWMNSKSETVELVCADASASELGAIDARSTDVSSSWQLAIAAEDAIRRSRVEWRKQRCGAFGRLG